MIARRFSRHCDHRRRLPRLGVICALLAGCLAGCVSRPEALPAAIATSGRPWGALQAPPDAPLHARSVLVLSGGGSNGAYGAGLLYGWSERGDRPDFDVVTGVSTGSLISPLAFLGSKYDERLRDFYTSVKKEDIFRTRYWVAAPFKDSVFSAEPLEELLENYITAEIIDEIAAEHRLGRRLYAGTTNLDTREFTIWDLGAIAASDRPDRAERFRQVMRASASIPIAFEPVYFDVEHDGRRFWQMHVDGGAVGPVFVRHWMRGPRVTSASEARQRQRDHGVYVILNLPLGIAAYTPPEAGLRSIGTASLETVNDAFNRVRLRTVADLARAHGYGFHYQAVPKDFENATNALAFDPEHLSNLFEHGRAVIKGETDQPAWLTTLPGS